MRHFEPMACMGFEADDEVPGWVNNLDLYSYRIPQQRFDSNLRVYFKGLLVRTVVIFVFFFPDRSVKYLVKILKL